MELRPDDVDLVDGAPFVVVLRRSPL